MKQVVVNRESAVKRLMKDWKELESTYMETIVARPLPDDLFQWHANLLAPKKSKYRGIVTHLHISFRDDYPHSPPTVRCCTPLNHSHIFNGYICLDMLQPFYGHEYSWGAWSSAYTVASLLRQLQIFFYEKEFINHYRACNTAEDDVQKSLEYKCDCGHDASSRNPQPWDRRWPSLSDMLESNTVKPTKTKKSVIDKSKRDTREKELVFLPDDCLLNIFSFLPVTALHKMAQVNPQWNRVSQSPSITIALDCRCFHSKQTYEEDVLGIGIKLEFTKARVLQHVSSPMDLISKTAFDEGVRFSVWHQPFTYFLPLYINKEHAARAAPLLENSVTAIYANIPTGGGSNNWITLFVDLLCKLMSTMVVEIMKDNLHASFVALEGYCHFHRWLIYLCETYPHVQTAIDNAIQKFIASDGQRSKEKRPNLGEFLPLLSVSKYNWHDAGTPVSKEVLHRNSLWIYLKDNQLRNYTRWRTDSKSIAYRLGTAFDTCKVSARLIMFHKMALELVKGGRNIREIAREYDYRFGRPSTELQQKLQNEIFKIQKCASYTDYFQYIMGLRKTNEEVDSMLNEAMSLAIKKGYLSGGNSQSGSPLVLSNQELCTNEPTRRATGTQQSGRSGGTGRGASQKTQSRANTKTTQSKANFNPYDLLRDDE